MNDINQALEKQNEIIVQIKNDCKKTNQRPHFHFACPAGWCNDPNGFSFYKNKIHLFYQWHPYATVWGPMHWGHATTEDFVNWDIQEPALAPDSQEDCEGCFSGTAIEFNGNHLICYTGVSNENGINIQNQCLAIGDGLKYSKFSSNPIITKNNVPFDFQIQDFRDPKIFYQDGNLYMLCVLKKNDGCGALVLFKNCSPNLEKWEYRKTICESSDGKTKMWECPDYFDLDQQAILLFSPQEMEEDFEKGFHKGNNSVYMIGKMDKEFNFSPELLDNELHYSQIDFGIDFYAPQTMRHPDGRRILIAWMQSWESPVTPKDFLWNGMMTFPRELEIKNNRLIQNPVREIISCRKNHRTFEINSNENSSLYIKNIRRCELEINFLPKEKHGKLILKLGDGNYFVSLCYDCENSLLSFDRAHTLENGGTIKNRSVKVETDGEKNVFLRILIDTASIECFVDYGRIAFTNAFFIPVESEGLCIESSIKNKIDVDYYEIEGKNLI